MADDEKQLEPRKEDQLSRRFPEPTHLFHCCVRVLLSNPLLLLLSFSFHVLSNKLYRFLPSFSQQWQPKTLVSFKFLTLNLFEIELKVTFFIVERNGGVDAEALTEVGKIISHVIHEFPLEDLINDGNGAVLDMLNSMRVPVQTSTVEKIAASAVRMAAAARDGGSKVLRMRVGIEAVVDDLPDFGHNDTDYDDDDEGTVTAEQATEKLVKVMVEVSGKNCAICLEELAMGSEAVCIPCSHTFQDICIAAWLKKKKRCPYCRFKLY